MHGHILSLLMDDDNYLIYKHVVVYPTLGHLSYVTGNCVASIFVSMIASIQETAYGVICYAENKFFVTEQRCMYNGFGKYPPDHKTIFLLESCFGFVAAVRHLLPKVQIEADVVIIDRWYRNHTNASANSSHNSRPR